MDQPRRQFLAETEDLIEQIFADLDELREGQDDGKLQRELVDATFRRLHRVKGSAASFGLDGLSEIAHEFETLLSALRAGQVPISEAVLDTCESATTALSESLSLAASGIVEPSRRELFERIQALSQVSPRKTITSTTDIETILHKLPLEMWQLLTDGEKSRLVRVVEEGAQLCVIATSFDITSFDEQFYGLKEKLAQHGEVIASSPVIDAERSDKINFRILFASNADVHDVEADLSDISGVSLAQITNTEGARAPGGEDKTMPATASLAAVNSSVSNFIRTDLDELDRLISSTHKLSRLTAKALDMALAPASARPPAGSELVQINAEIRQSFLSVENELINLRMVSLGPILQRAARAGRAAARLSNKEIDFEIVGTNLRLDKLLRDAIADPLVHLVRNAVDHGIETEPARAESGKNRRGLVRIEAVNEGSQTRVRVTDDGCGVDPVIVARVASAMGIIDPSRVVDMDRSLRLIFRPGFSTLSSASTVSGRGVGLDVVETAVEQVGGEVRVSSEPGRGSIFEIRLPVTFGLLRSTIVVSGNNRYCIDASQVVRTAKIDAARMDARPSETVQPDASLRSEKGMLPLMRLSELLGQASDATPATSQLNVITCELSMGGAGEIENRRAPEHSKGEHMRGEVSGTLNRKKLIDIVVDDVEGTEEVLVRNLGHHAARWYGIAGATELRDGTVALVLDLPRLLSDAGR